MPPVPVTSIKSRPKIPWQILSRAMRSSTLASRESRSSIRNACDVRSAGASWGLCYRSALWEKLIRGEGVEFGEISDAFIVYLMLGKCDSNEEPIGNGLMFIGLMARLITSRYENLILERGRKMNLRTGDISITKLVVIAVVSIVTPSTLLSQASEAKYSNAIADCDRLAAHPEDPQRVTEGVSQTKIDFPKAVDSCERAVNQAPENARVRYQLARVLFYTNQNERAVKEMQRSADDGHIQSQYIFGTFVARGRPFAPRDICIAERYWRKAANARRQAARVQYVRYFLKGRFAGCAEVAGESELMSFVDSAGKDANGLYEQIWVEDFREALAQRPNRAAEELWETCTRNRGIVKEQPLRVRRFGDTEEMTSQLNALILSGEKTMTAYSPWLVSIDASKQSAEGGYSVLVDAVGAPQAILRTTSLRTLRFDTVTAEDSQYEGKPVRPLAAWQRVHKAYFERSLAPAGKAWAPDMPVTLELFEVVCGASIPATPR